MTDSTSLVHLRRCLIRPTSPLAMTIFPYLGAADFLSLTSSCKSLSSFKQDPNFWRVLTRSTFRVPPQPLLQADGARWQWLYKNISTRMRLFTWGNNARGNLGHDSQQHRRVTWPLPVEIDHEIGLVVDVQCGGWSTLLMNSIGTIYAFGAINHLHTVNNPIDWEFRKLLFPPSYPPTTNNRYEPRTAIRHFSAGRAHVLGLADNGNVWFWCKEIAFLVNPLNVDLVEHEAMRVVGGWDRSSIYVNGVGIVFWTPNLLSSSEECDRNVVSVETTLIPGTGFRRKRGSRMACSDLEARIGEVTNHVVLEGYIVFVTDLNKVFGYPTEIPISDLAKPEPIELTNLYPKSIPTPFQIRDVQGSFRSFAIFTTSGFVISASCSLINALYDEDPDAPLAEPTQSPALQGKSVISISFGDYHHHVLYANGTIASSGRDCNNCGSLGLGDQDKARLRGVMHVGRTEGTLDPEHYQTVWFEPLMSQWLENMVSKSKHGEGRERGLLLRSGHGGALHAIGDFFEREGARWEDGVLGPEELGAEELGSYFVLKVSAAGWHSAALVLVDEEKAQRARDKHTMVRRQPDLLSSGATAPLDDRPDSVTYSWTDDPFPRLRMPDGEVMPGRIAIT